MEDKEEKKLFAKLNHYQEPIELKDIPCNPPDYIIRCVEGPFEGKQFHINDLGNEFKIGSDDNCDFCIKDEALSLKHCQITVIKGSVLFSLKDLDSKEGTWLKISSLEDGYEIIENSIFKIFQHEFEIIKKDNTNLLIFKSGNKMGSQYVIQDNTTLMIGKKNCDIELEYESNVNFSFKIYKSKDKLFIIDCTEEISENGLFMKLNKEEFAVVRGGDIFKVGKSSLRILVHNWGIFSEIGDRKHLEDKFCIIDDMRLFDNMIIPYYAVYDGHGGVSCSLYLQRHLHRNLKDLIRLRKIANSKNFFHDLCETIQDAIMYTDVYYYETENSAIHHGSTCVFNFFIGNKILCCNLGDSISILVRSNLKVYLSKDFRPTREKEKGRILDRKGYVTNDGRLLGIISVSRGFGDWKFKDPKKKEFIKKQISNKSFEFDEYLISNKAEFRIIDLDPHEDKYIIIVSDGIFHHSPNSNFIFDTINKYMNDEKDKRIKNIPNVVDNLRLDLINNIYGDPTSKGKSDNMTLILINLDK